MPSIAFLSFGIGRSGGEKVIVKLANGLQKKGWDASIVAPRNAIKDFYPITAKVIATEPFRQVPFLEIPWSKQVLTRNCPKVDIVVGSSSRDEAKIAGMTPAGFTLIGRWLEPPS